jgi:tetratricopeptide (TPR) repeat protein
MKLFAFTLTFVHHKKQHCMEMDDATFEKIEKLTAQANDLIDEDDFGQAIAVLNEALALVPAPKTDWEASTWIYATLGDVYFITEDYSKAKNAFYDAYNCPGGIENPFICLRLGESLFESNEMDKAKEYLLRAYMLEGNEIFEEEDEKYFALIKNIV